MVDNYNLVSVGPSILKPHVLITVEREFICRLNILISPLDTTNKTFYMLFIILTNILENFCLVFFYILIRALVAVRRLYVLVY